MEPMAIERLVGARLELEGYATLLRVPFKRERGHGDLDVVGVHLRPPHVIVVECKAWGSPEHYPTFKRQRSRSLRAALDGVHDGYRKFLRGPTNVYGIKGNDRVEFWLVLPGAIDQDLEREVQSKWPRNYKLIAIHTVLRDLLALVQVDSPVRRKRYADTALEMMRWLVRAHSHGHFDLSEVQVEMERRERGRGEWYAPYVRNYINATVKAVLANARNQETRRKALAGMLRVVRRSGPDVTISEIVRDLESAGLDVTRQQVTVGLNTWLSLGIVVQRKVGRGYVFTIPPPFVKVLRGLRQLRLSVPG